jgi:DnaJ-class molecular chaperone
VDFLEAARGAKKRITMPDGKTLDIAVPEGIEEGQKLRLKGQGKPSSGSHPIGDAYVEVHINAHPFFTRQGKDVRIEVPVALQESVLGGKIKVPTIHGAVDMAIPKGASSGATLRLKGRGIKGGDQYVTLKLVMPQDIDSELEDAIRKWSQTHSYNPRKHMETAL